MHLENDPPKDWGAWVQRALVLTGWEPQGVGIPGDGIGEPLAVDLASGIFLRGHSLLWSQPRQADKRTESPFIHRGAFGSPETLKPGLRQAGSASPAGAEMDSRQRENLGPGASRSQAAGPGVMGRRQLSGADNGPPEPPPWSQLPSPATPPWGGGRF